MSNEEIESFLERSPTGVLTSLGSDGWPHSVAMWFVPVFDGDRREVLMWSYTKSQKSVNLMRDPRSAFLVEEGVEYLELRGVLVRSRARIIERVADITDIGRRLHERYVTSRTGRPAEEAALAEIERQATKRIGLSLSLERTTSWDHGKLGNGY
jgi:nitroimidazol reductase NimA-like FMN-containing flavoprotein (pyridoxamine 5'-phosphate oxidase superfamily)